MEYVTLVELGVLVTIGSGVASIGTAIAGHFIQRGRNLQSAHNRDTRLDEIAAKLDKTDGRIGHIERDMRTSFVTRHEFERSQDAVNMHLRLIDQKLERLLEQRGRVAPGKASG